jgi:hypothetical protein
VADRVSAILVTPQVRLLASKHQQPDGTVEHRLPGGSVAKCGMPLEDALQYTLRRQLSLEAVIGQLIQVLRSGPQDEYVFVSQVAAGNLPSPDGREAEISAASAVQWEEIALTPEAIHAANLQPEPIAMLLAGHLRHGQTPVSLPDVRSRPAATRRHHNTR